MRGGYKKSNYDGFQIIMGIVNQVTLGSLESILLI
jgi:hypothetical protein